jgi:hypothetical protein
VPAAAERLRRGLALARARAQPLDVVRPPAAALGRGVVEPVLGVVPAILADVVARAALRTGRVDERLDMAARGKDEAGVSAEQEAAAVGVLPGHDVVVEPGDDVCVDIDVRELHRRSQGRHRARSGEEVVERDPHEVAVQPADSRTVSWFQ